MNGRLFISTDKGLLPLYCDFESSIMKELVTLAHSTSHLGIKKLFDHMNQQYYGIKRKIVEEVVGMCQCHRVQPLKTYDEVKAVTAVTPNERWQIDLIDMSKYSSVSMSI